MAEEGWIKISRRITEHWIWDRPLYLKWWIDMVMMAAWREEQRMINGRICTIKRGQLAASVEFLRERWEYRHEMGRAQCKIQKPASATIRRFMGFLLESKMILRELKKLPGNVPLITICNYDRYNTISEGNCSTAYSTCDTTKGSGNDTTKGSGKSTIKGSGTRTTCATTCAPQLKNNRIKEDNNPPSPRAREVENFQNIPPVPPEWPEVREYFHEISAVREFRSWEGAARKFYDHFSAAGWRDAKNRPIADWQARANLWIEEDINKPKKSDRNGEQAKTMGAADRRRPAEPPRAGTADWDAAF